MAGPFPIYSRQTRGGSRASVGGWLPADPPRAHIDNLALFCHYHHRLFHDDGWAVRRSCDGTLTIIDPSDRELHALPSRASPALAAAA